jgi:transcriptional regulator with AAA-type ATPase domain
VSALTPFCAGPVVTPEDPIGTALAVIDKGSVILENVSRLTLEEQRQILSWLDVNGCGVRLIATTTEQLYDLVEGGQVIATLYSRLNVMFIDLPSDSLFAIFSSFLGG